MHQLFVGVGHVSVYMRHARTLKDKRQVLQSLKQRLKNQGFSAAECGYLDNPKQGSIGFSYVGHNYGDVDMALNKGLQLFIGNFDIINTNKDIVDYSNSEELQEALDYDDEDE